jgi:carbon monoxide dehydrogenase subunit G
MAIELDNSFTVPVPPEQAWDVLLDVERITPCMPGASVLSISADGNEVEGQVKVKLGPLSLTYKGTAKFAEKDQANHAIAIDASGKETRGAGTASAAVHASLKPDETGTLVSIHTSLNVTGRPAQFGRSLLPEVSGKLIEQFATNLEALITSGTSAATAAGTAAPGDTATPVDTAAPRDTATAQDTATPEETGAATAGGTVGGTPGGTVAAAPGEAAATTATATPGAASTGAASTGSASAGSASAAAKPALPAFQHEESLSAFKFVVVPVLKRLIPVAAAGALITLIIRRLTGRKKTS